MFEISSRQLPPSVADFEQLAEESWQNLPEEVRAACGGLAVRIEDFASDEVLDELGFDDPYELTGLYEGVAITERSVLDQPSSPDVVWLFRRPILEEWIDRGDVDLGHLVRHVLVHEIAHHLGWSDEDIMAVDDWTE